MKSCKQLLILINLLGFFGLNGIADGAFPGIFPLLTSGWYYKPSPAESVVLGLILVKVLALRLASATGLLPIPYHLNDLFLRSLGKRSIALGTMEYTNHTSTSTSHFNKSHRIKYSKISPQEFDIIERILLSLRRIDSSDCFIRLICELNQDLLSGKVSLEDEQYLKVFRLRQKMNAHLNGNWSIWDTYEEAVKLETTDCSKKYPACPLTKKDLEYETMISGIF